MAGRWRVIGLLLAALALIAEPAHAAHHARTHVLRHAAAKKAPATAPTQPAPKAVPVPEVNATPLAPPPPAELTVAAIVAPPFAMQRPDGAWSGLSVGLWKAVADDLRLPFRLVPADRKTALNGVADGRFDAAVGALSVTPTGEQRVDFTQPFYATGLAIAVPADGKGILAGLAVLQRVASWQFLGVVLSLLALLLVSGLLTWLFERRRNPQFQGPWYRGIGDGMWWSAVTMTTVGYGDKAPISLGGRAVGLLWMFTTLVAIGVFTAAVTATLTVSALKDGVHGYADLHRVRIGVVRDTPAADALRDQGFVARGYAGVKDGLAAVAAGEIGAFVYDAPVLLYAAARDYPKTIRILPDRFIRQDYGFALRQGSSLREKIDADLLERIRSPAWHDAVARYLGPDEAATALP
jgi:ABC-type amino acid transport substrate-binding protein